jgi:hypothetical protein
MADGRAASYRQPVADQRKGKIPAKRETAAEIALESQQHARHGECIDNYSFTLN